MRVLCFLNTAYAYILICKTFLANCKHVETCAHQEILLVPCFFLFVLTFDVLSSKSASLHLCVRWSCLRFFILFFHCDFFLRPSSSLSQSIRLPFSYPMFSCVCFSFSSPSLFLSLPFPSLSLCPFLFHLPTSPFLLLVLLSATLSTPNSLVSLSLSQGHALKPKDANPPCYGGQGNINSLQLWATACTCVHCTRSSSIEVHVTLGGMYSKFKCSQTALSLSLKVEGVEPTLRVCWVGSSFLLLNDLTWKAVHILCSLCATDLFWTLGKPETLTCPIWFSLRVWQIYSHFKGVGKSRRRSLVESQSKLRLEVWSKSSRSLIELYMYMLQNTTNTNVLSKTIFNID